MDKRALGESGQNDKKSAQLYRNCTQSLMSIGLMQTGKLERERVSECGVLGELRRDRW